MRYEVLHQSCRGYFRFRRHDSKEDGQVKYNPSLRRRVSPQTAGPPPLPGKAPAAELVGDAKAAGTVGDAKRARKYMAIVAK